MGKEQVQDIRFSSEKIGGLFETDENELCLTGMNALIRNFLCPLAVVTGLSSVADANVDVCFQASGTLAGTSETLPMVGAKVWYAQDFWDVALTAQGTTDENGCISLPKNPHFKRWLPDPEEASFNIQAENNVIAIVDGIPVAARRDTQSAGTVILGEEFYLAQKFKDIFLGGLAGHGPFGTVRPSPPPYVITAVIDSNLIVSSPFIEPSPALGTALPRIHLPELASTQEVTLRNALGSALVLSKMDIIERDFYQAEYLAALAADPEPWSITSPANPVIAWVEAFGLFAQAITHPTVQGSELAFFEEDPGSQSVLNTFGATAIGPSMTTIGANRDLWRDDIPGTVFAALFLEYGRRVGLDFVIDTYVSCGAHDMQAYTQCIADMYTQNSPEFTALRNSLNWYEIPMDQFADYCSAANPCGSYEGDCDSDAECVGARYCQNNGTAPNNACVTRWDFCSPDHPCEWGQGDCDNAEDCEGWLLCYQQPGVDVCAPPILGPTIPVIWN